MSSVGGRQNVEFGVQFSKFRSNDCTHGKTLNRDLNSVV